MTPHYPNVFLSHVLTSLLTILHVVNATTGLGLFTPLNVLRTLLTSSLTASQSSKITELTPPSTCELTQTWKITVYLLRRCCCAVLFLAFFNNQWHPLLDSRICRWSLEANQLSRPKSDRSRFNPACHWFGVIKGTALRSRGFSHGSNKDLTETGNRV